MQKSWAQPQASGEPEQGSDQIRDKWESSWFAFPQAIVVWLNTASTAKSQGVTGEIGSSWLSAGRLARLCHGKHYCL